jgi:NADH:ubiquinone oxidoreductase subunit D
MFEKSGARLTLNFCRIGGVDSDFTRISPTDERFSIAFREGQGIRLLIASNRIWLGRNVALLG